MKRIGIAELKAKLSENLDRVRRGESITVLDRKTPVARIVPYESPSDPLRIRRAKNAVRLGRIGMPRATRVRRDIVRLLLEDRSVR